MRSGTRREVLSGPRVVYTESAVFSVGLTVEQAVDEVVICAQVELPAVRDHLCAFATWSEIITAALD